MNSEEQNLNQVNDVPVKPELSPPLEPAIEPNGETYTAVQPDLETLDASPNIETLSVDPALASGLPDVNSIPPLKEEPVVEKKKKSSKGKLIIILVLLLLAIGAFVFYQFFMNNPYNVYKTIISKSFGETRTVLEKMPNFNSPISYTGSVKLENNLEELKALNDYTFDYGLGFDAPNNKVELMLGLSEKDKSLLEAFAYLLDDKMYLKSEKLYEKILLLGDAEVDLSDLAETYTNEDILYLYDKLELALLNSFTKDDFASSSANINVNGEQLKVKDNYLLITSQNIGMIIERFINTFKSDDKALEILAEILMISKEEIVNSFDEFIAVDYTDTEGVVKISIYTQNFTNKIIGYSVKLDDTEVIKAGFKGDKGEIDINLDSMVIACNIDGNVTDCALQEAETVLASFKLTKVSDTNNKIEFSMEGIAINVSLDAKEESSAISTQDIIVEVIIPEEELNIKVTINNKVETNKAIGNIDVSSAKDINSLTDSELEEITNKLQTILEPTALYGLLESFMDTDYNGGSSTEVNPACANATCTNCSGDTCTCQYYDNTFTLQTITCPNDTYY